MKRTLKTLLIFLLMMVLTGTTVFAGVEVTPEGRLKIDQKDYTDSTDGTFTFGTNLWHTRYFRTETGLPLEKLWSVDLIDLAAKEMGLSGKEGLPAEKRYAMGQPIITNQYVIATAADCLLILDRKTRQLKSCSRLQHDNGKRAIYSSPLYIENSSRWFSADNNPRIIQGTRDGYVYCLRLLPDGTTDIDPQWVATSVDQKAKNPGTPCLGDGGIYTWSNVAGTRYSGLVSSPGLIFDRNTSLSEPYIVFGTYNKQVYILNARNGYAVQDKELNILDRGITLNGSTGSSPISFRHSDFPEVFSEFALGISKSTDYRPGEGFVFGGGVRDGKFIPDNKLNEASFKSDPIGRSLYGFPNSVAVAEWHKGGDNTDYVMVFADRQGNIYGMNQYDKTFLFKINTYTSHTCFNTPTIVDDKFALITLSNPAKVVCVDIQKAIDLGAANPDRLANDAVFWETADDDFGGVSYIGSSAMRIMDPKGLDSEAVVICGDETNYTHLPNLKAYYVKQQTTAKNPVPVEDAFFDPTNGAQPYSYGALLPGGVKGEPSFHGGLIGSGGEQETLLVTADGQGTLHGFQTRIIQNLKMISLQNTLDGQILETFESGKNYTLKATIANETGKVTPGIPLDITADLGPSPQGMPNTLRVYGAQGLQTFDLTDHSNSDVYDEWDPVYGPEDPETKKQEKLYDNKASWRISGVYLKAGGTKAEIDFSTEGVTKNELTYTVGINRGPDPKPLIETTYDDNGLTLILKRGLPDLKVQDLKVWNPRPGRPIGVQFTVKNISEKNTPGDTQVEVFVDGQLKSTSRVAIMSPGVECPFSLSLPGVGAGQHTLKVVVNRNESDFEEMNYDNNTQTKNFVAEALQVCRGNQLEASGRYSVYTGDNDPYGGRYVRDIIHRWKDSDDNWHNDKIGEVREWVAKLEYSVTFSAREIKSGHGVQCKVALWKGSGSHIYDSRLDLDGARMELFGDSGAGTFVYKEKIGNQYIYELVPPTVKNPLHEPKHFVPVSWKDGAYHIKICGDSIGTPGKDLTFEYNTDLSIKGHMYMDDVTN